MRLFIFIIILISYFPLKSQTYEIAGSFFRNRYAKSDNYSDLKSRFENGFGISIKRFNFKDSVNPVLRNMELAAAYYSGNCYYAQEGSHFGSSWVNLHTKKLLFTAGFYPINIRLFDKKTHISIGGIFGAFLMRNTTGERSELHVKDTFVKPYGWVTYSTNLKTYFNGKTKDDRKFIFGIGVNLDQVVYTSSKGILKLGAFARFYLTPEYAYLAYLYPRQFGLQISWIFKK